MNDALEQLQHELEAAQRALAEAGARATRHDDERLIATKVLDGAFQKIELAHQEWMAALDTIEDPIFLHDRDFHILRCNRAYQRCAGIPFKQIIGQPYYSVFPKTHAPLRCCLRAMEKAEANTDAEEELIVGDATYRSRAFAVHDVQGVYLYSIHTLEDITERLRERRILQESEMRYRRLFEAAKDGILILDAETGKIVDANPFILNLLSYTLSECVGKMLWEIGLFADTEVSKLAFKDLQTKGHIRYEDLPLETKDGQRRDVEFVSNVYEADGRKVIQCNIRDITEHLRAECALRDSEARYRRITEGLTDYRYTVRIENGRAVETTQSPACVMVTGYKAEDFSANPHLWIQMVAPEDRERVIRHAQQVLAGADVPPIEHRIIRKNGESIWVSDTIILFRNDSGKLLSYDGVIKDITERRIAENTLRESEEKYRLLFESSRDALMILAPPSWKYTSANTATLQLFGAASAAEFTTLGPWNVSPERQPDGRPSAEKVQEMIATAMREGSHFFEWMHQHIDGTPFAADVLLTSMGEGEQVSVQATVRDISERKRAEASLRRANRALITLSAGNLALVRAASEGELLRTVVNVIVEKGGHRLAAVCYAEDNSEKSITPMAWAGAENSYYWTGQPSWADTEQGQLPIARAMRSGTTQICRDIAGDMGYVPWKDAALARGYTANIALPLACGGKTFGGLSIYSSEADAFDEEEVMLLEELANDLAYGIVTLRTRAEHEQHAQILRESLEQSIQTIADTVEARDPYTAGHQRRVAELATAIAREMALPYEQVNGIHLAAIIHDLGKIHIPAEILAKPGKLTDIEFMLIKTHPQSGYDILKDVQFPWPIADIILQHHERLDGSGYPQGLKGGQILLESKILTVADVAEAMSSHRPYRPALGAEAALSELERGRGSAYDPVIVDVCLKLFTKKGFTFIS